MNKRKIIKIAFDLDGVIVDKPPLIPKKLLERLFRGKSNHKLHYRFPNSVIEQKIRKLSHYYLFRPPIKKNIEFIRKLAENNKYELFIISARYSFLEKETKIWLNKRKLDNIFKGVYLNLFNKQPHLFKEEVLKNLKPEIFIDDDYLLADYLVEKKASKNIYCFSLDDSEEKCKKAKTLSFDGLKKLL
jgi:uncharacterized HAD superfamily protein